MKTLHGLGLYHGDIKGENFLITFDDRIIKMGDLGTLLKMKDEGKYL